MDSVVEDSMVEALMEVLEGANRGSVNSKNLRSKEKIITRFLE